MARRKKVSKTARIKAAIRIAGRAVILAQQGSRKVVENFDFDEPMGVGRTPRIGQGLDTGVGDRPAFRSDNGTTLTMGRKTTPKKDLTDIF
jgi:hypothetical protein